MDGRCCAMIHGARKVNECPITGETIADATGITRTSLAPALCDLVHAPVPETAQPHCGRQSRYAVVRALWVVDVRSHDDSCTGHDEWKRARGTCAGYLENHSTYDVASTPRRWGETAAPKRTKR